VLADTDSGPAHIAHPPPAIPSAINCGRRDFNPFSVRKQKRARVVWTFSEPTVWYLSREGRVKDPAGEIEPIS
jgi:hypothetical protein